MPNDSLVAPAPDPPTPLGRYRNLSKLASVFVSPFCLGGAIFGEAWENVGIKGMNKEKSFELLDAFFAMGGNFIDTASTYQDEQSEKIIGEWMESRGNRDQIVLATKFSANYKRGDRSIPSHAKVNYVGNGAKSMTVALRDSLQKLRTEYVDILYVHMWGYDTTIPEVMGHLHDLVASGKVLYLGISDTPAWVVAQANQWAVDHGKTPFVVYQGAWNVMDRAFERDIIPVAREWGMALCPWNIIASGKLRSDAEEQRRKETGERGRDLYGTGWERTPQEKNMCEALDKIAKEVGGSVSSVAIAYLMQKTTYVVPIVGVRRLENLKDNLKALEISLTAEHIAYLESIIPFDLGFPHNFIGVGEAPNAFWNAVGRIDRPGLPVPVRPVRK